MLLPASGGSSEPVLEFAPSVQNGFDCPTQPSSSCVLGVWEQGQLIFYSLPYEAAEARVARTNVETAKGFSFVISPDGSRIATEVPHQQIRILDFAQ